MVSHSDVLFWMPILFASALLISGLVFIFKGRTSSGDAVYIDIRKKRFKSGSVGVTLIILSILCLFAPYGIAFLGGKFGSQGLPNSTPDLVGVWTWQYAERNWRAQLAFQMQGGDLIFDGTLFENKVPIYKITEGRAKQLPKGLSFQCRAQDLKTKEELIWETVEPLRPGLSFEGLFKSRNARQDSWPAHQWGIAIYKTQSPPLE